MPRFTHQISLVLFFAASVLCTGHAVGAIDVIDGREVESMTIKNPNVKAVVVFENGSRATLDKWDKVVDAIAPNASVFTYNRPGYGNSQATDTPRDGLTIVEELRVKLKYQGLAPPYVLVGHSLGGLYVQLFARRYPNEVSGIVLVDSLYPKVVKKPGDFPLSTRFGKWLFFSSSIGKEIDLIHETGEQVMAAGSIDDKPIIKLINRPKGATAIPVDFGVINTDQQTASFVQGLYPNAKKIIVDSDHQMQTANPREVAAAINEMINGVTYPIPDAPPCSPCPSTF
jgi:pimeloyl-ACP methyl ester carboxylesterase